MRVPAFAGVILAAGSSSRMGRDKALLPWPPGSRNPSDTFLRAGLRTLRPHCDFVLVVAGANAPTLEPVVNAAGGDLVVNPDPERGQFSSLRIALREVLVRGRDAAIVTLVDRPPCLPETVLRLRDEFASSPDDIWAVIPQNAGDHGHPVVFGREMIEAMLRAPESSNAREVLHAIESRLRYVDVDDPFVSLNINTPEEYAKLTTART